MVLHQGVLRSAAAYVLPLQLSGHQAAGGQRGERGPSESLPEGGFQPLWMCWTLLGVLASVPGDVVPAQSAAAGYSDVSVPISAGPLVGDVRVEVVDGAALPHRRLPRLWSPCLPCALMRCLPCVLMWMCMRCGLLSLVVRCLHLSKLRYCRIMLCVMLRVPPGALLLCLVMIVIVLTTRGLSPSVQGDLGVCLLVVYALGRRAISQGF